MEQSQIQGTTSTGHVFHLYTFYHRKKDAQTRPDGKSDQVEVAPLKSLGATNIRSRTIGLGDNTNFQMNWNCLTNTIASDLIFVALSG